MAVRAYPLGDLLHRKQGEMAFRPSRMRTRRTELGMSQPELAKRIKTTQPRISLWEKGKEKPTFDYLARLAKALECSADWLLGLSDDPLGYLRESDLSADERRFLNAYRRHDQDTVQNLIARWLQEKLNSDPDLSGLE